MCPCKRVRSRSRSRSSTVSPPIMLRAARFPQWLQLKRSAAHLWMRQPRQVRSERKYFWIQSRAVA